MADPIEALVLEGNKTQTKQIFVLVHCVQSIACNRQHPTQNFSMSCHCVGYIQLQLCLLKNSSIDKYGVP